MKNWILIFVSFSFWLFSCSSSDSKIKKLDTQQEVTFENLFTLAMKQQLAESHTFSMLNDSLKTYTLSFWMNMLIEINETSKEISYVFEKNDGEIPVTDPRYFFKISFTPDFSPVIDSQSVSLNDITQIAYESIYNVDTGHIAYKEAQIDNYGTEKVSFVTAILFVDFNNSIGIPTDFWNNIYKCIKSVIEAQEKKKEEISYAIWGKTFGELNFEDKIIATQIAGSHVSVVFAHSDL